MSASEGQLLHAAVRLVPLVARDGRVVSTRGRLSVVRHSTEAPVMRRLWHAFLHWLTRDDEAEKLARCAQRHAVEQQIHATHD